MKRGEVWWVDFDPAIGGEIRKRRPAVIVSNDMANKVLNRVQVMPISSQVGKLYPCEADVNLKGKMGKAMADQLTTASKQRLKQRITVLNRQEMTAIEQAIKLQLSLS